MKKTYQLTVVKSNRVVEASYLLTLSEQRVLLACIAQVNSKKPLTTDYRFQVTAVEIAKLVGLKNPNNAYRDLKRAAEKLYERSVVIDNPDPDKPEIKKRKTRWVSGIDYIPDKGVLVLRFAPDIIPYLSQLTREFTQYKLKHVAKFESVYSIRIYELLMQWVSVGEREIEVSWLKKQLQVGDKYTRVADLKTRVIEPAIREINKHSNMWVEYNTRKSGRNVTHFLFMFGLKEPLPNRPSVTEAEIIRKARPGESRAGVVARLTSQQ